MIIEKFLPKIEELKQGKPLKQQENLEILRYHGEYSIRLAKALYHLSLGEETEANKYYKEFCRYVQSIELRIQKYLDVYRIIEVSTKYNGFRME